MKRTRLERGTLMSCLTFPPSRLTAEGMVSRQRQKASRSDSLRLTAPSRISPFSRCGARTPSSSSEDSSESRRQSETSRSTCQSERGTGGVMPVTAESDSSGVRPMSSKAVRPGPKAASSVSKSVSTSSRRRGVIQAETIERGMGSSARTASVMTPSVPSDPMKTSRRL